MTRALVILLSCWLLTGCHRRADGAALAGPRRSPIERSRELALVAPEGAAPVDGEIARLQESARRSPGKVDLWVALGRAWVRKAREASDPGYYRSADACADVALDLSPALPMALDLRGLVLLNGHRFAEARDLARGTTRQAPADPMAWGTLSDALLELGDFPGAADAAQRMVDLKPNGPSYLRAAHLRWLSGDVAGARQVLRLAIDAASDPRDPEPRAFALGEAAMTFWHQGDYDGARAGFQQALALAPGYPAALVGLARCDLAGGDARKAVERLSLAAARSPLVETRWLLGDACEMAGDARCADEARALVRKQGRRSDPRTLSLFLSTRGEAAAEALELAQGEAATRGDPYTLDALGFALLRAGRFEEARRAADKALALGTRDARILFHAGAILVASGEVERGRGRLREALALNPRFDVHGAAEAARLLARGR